MKNIFARFSQQEVGKFVTEFMHAIDRGQQPSMDFLMKIKPEKREEIEASSKQLAKSLHFFKSDLMKATQRFLQTMDQAPEKLFEGPMAKEAHKLSTAAINHLNELVNVFEHTRTQFLDPLKKVVAAFARLAVMANPGRVVDPVQVRNDLEEIQRILNDNKLFRNLVANFFGSELANVTAYELTAADHEAILVFCRDNKLIPLFEPLYAQYVLKANNPFSARRMAQAVLSLSMGKTREFEDFLRFCSRVVKNGDSPHAIKETVGELRMSPLYPLALQYARAFTALAQAKRAEDSSAFAEFIATVQEPTFHIASSERVAFEGMPDDCDLDSLAERLASGALSLVQS